MNDIIGGQSANGNGLHRSSLECSEALLRVFEFLDGEMTEVDEDAVRAHLDACAECLRKFDLDQMVKFVVKRSCEPVAAPSHLRTTIVQRLTVMRMELDD
ncbi:MAG: mycothiol system anti-sigma-R factor [Actinomycetales bacterium]|nr:MAG: mycothiol system anti-sigma-R factor [Actinomycetales bacterium]